MTVLTYNNLVQQVQATFNRTDQYFVNLIPQFVTQAQNRLVGEATSLEMVVYANNTIYAGSNQLVKPEQWRRPLSLKLQLPYTFPNGSSAYTYQNVEWRSYDFCRDYWPVDGTINNVNNTLLLDPLFYGDYGQQYLILSPTPYRALNVEMSFYGLPPVIGPLVQTNYLTEYAPNALIYATFIEAAYFVDNDSRLPVWQQAYSSAVEALNNISEDGKADRLTDIGKD